MHVLLQEQFIWTWCQMYGHRHSRGITKLMISDNGACFKNEEVRLSEELLEMGITWKFIVQVSLWWGGFWKRLVKTV